MVPLKVLVFSVLPLPSNLLAEVPSTLARSSWLDDTNGNAVTLPCTVPVLSILLVLSWLAATASTMLTVMVSPTMRAR